MHFPDLLRVFHVFQIKSIWKTLIYYSNCSWFTRGLSIFFLKNLQFLPLRTSNVNTTLILSRQSRSYKLDVREMFKIPSIKIPSALKLHSDHNPLGKKWWGGQNPLNLLVCIYDYGNAIRFWSLCHFWTKLRGLWPRGFWYTLAYLYLRIIIFICFCLYVHTCMYNRGTTISKLVHHQSLRRMFWQEILFKLLSLML